MTFVLFYSGEQIYNVTYLVRRLQQSNKIFLFSTLLTYLLLDNDQ